MKPDSSTIAFKLFNKDGRKYVLTKKGETAIRAILGPDVPESAVLTVESSDDGLRVVATFATPESE
jgi:hypothetical protein